MTTSIDPRDAAHRAAVLQMVASTIGAGITDFHEILCRCAGADPRLVWSCFQETRAESKPGRADRRPNEHVRLPAPDPVLSQWWFLSEAIERLRERVNQVCVGSTPRVLCIGAPSVSHWLARSDVSVTALDVDPDVIAALTAPPALGAAILYDVADDLPDELRGTASAAIIDPPWYEASIRAFIKRGLEALHVDGMLLASLPPRLTKPGVEEMVTSIVGELIRCGHELVALEREQLPYSVPRFEAVALSEGSFFPALPWRRGDLLMIRKRSESPFEAPQLPRVEVTAWARNPRDFRVFTRRVGSLGEQLLIRPLNGYSDNISTRAHGGNRPDLWTSEKSGYLVGGIELVTAALQEWSAGAGPTATADRLEAAYGHVGREVVSQLDEKLGLWRRFAAVPPLRSDQEIAEAKKSTLSEWATAPSPREHENEPESFRDQFQRDRDRIIWSGSFRKSAHKTQLFPVEHDDAVRQRLTHSIEVVQLASTIGWSFGLDQTLIEAGGLAHDIGHTPFGHAGEYALDRVLRSTVPGGTGFNHYEHGVDVVRWLEGPYNRSSGVSHHGLNLTREVAECILKHAFCQRPSSTDEKDLLEQGKHSGFIKPGLPHLEGQAIRIADKVSYLVSDIEDGIRLGALRLADLQSCRFFHRPPLDLRPRGEDSLLQRFIAERRIILKLIMEDILIASNKNLAQAGSRNVRDLPTYLITYSDEMTEDVNEIWKRLQKGRLHEDRRVRATNLKAATVVSELLVLFTLCPELVDPAFREEHERLWTTKYMAHYLDQTKKVIVRHAQVGRLPISSMIGAGTGTREGFEVRMEHLVQAKDFVAAFSDEGARRAHQSLIV